MKSRIADFPDWFGPMLVKELRQGLKTRGFAYSFIGLQTVLVFVMVIAVLVYARDAQDFDANLLGVIFWVLIGGMLIFVTPLRALNELAAERKANTLELIFMSGLSAWRIVFGKWVSLLFQALLFLLAILPFVILRYYFGGVNLAEDLQSLLIMVLSCAVATAVALAISGMPLWVRVMVGVGLVLSFPKSDGLDFIEELVEYARGGGPGSFHSIGKMNWWLTGFNSLLACLLALEIGAATVAQSAENYAGRQRFLALLFWLPLPVLHQVAVSEETQYRQLLLFMSCSGVLIWQHLSMRPVLFENHCRPFRGWRSIYGLPFQIGWPSAVVFLLLEVVLVVLAMPALGSLDPLSVDLVPYFVMASAALLSAVVFWKAFFSRVRFALAIQTMFSALCSLIVTIIVVAKPTTMHIGDAYGFAILPAMGFCVMRDDYPSAMAPWLVSACLALVAYASLLLLWSRRYWAQYTRTCRALAHPAPPAEYPLAA